jgi:hypothetical protein
MKYPFLLLCSLFLFASCKKDIDELPAATQTGANTFGAKLNGENWVPQKFGIVSTSPILEARYAGNNSVFINARDFSASPTETEFEIYLKGITGPGTFQLNQATAKYPDESASYGLYTKSKFMPVHDWITTPQYTGSVVVTRFDTVNHIISGTFAFSAASIDNSADPIQVTDGRFDVTIQ